MKKEKNINRIALIYPLGKNVVRKGLSLPVLYSYLKSKKINSLIIDCPGLKYTFDMLNKDLDRYCPDIIGISVAGTCMRRDTMEVCLRLREIYPDKLILLGGVEVSSSPSTYLDYCDIAVIGYGHETLRKIIELYPSNDVYKIPGIIYKKNGQTFSNPSTKEDINVPGPDFKCIPLEKYYSPIIFGNLKTDAVPNFFSLGCHYRCGFCKADYMDQKVYLRDINMVIEEIKRDMRLYNKSYFVFYDPLFNSSKERVLEVCNKITASGLKIRFLTSIAYKDFNDQIAIPLREAGCVALTLGLESGSERILKSMGKNQNLRRDVIEKTHESLHRAGILVYTQTMLGFPEDDLQSMWDTINYASKLHTDSLGISSVVPYPGTLIEKQVKRLGIKLLCDISDADPYKPTFIPKGLDGIDMMKCKKFHLYHFYTRNRQRLESWLSRWKDKENYYQIRQEWEALYNIKGDMTFDYFCEYVYSSSESNKFVEPFLPDFSAAHKLEHKNKL